ncbi:uncharacterized protein LOC125786977 [Astyanax mexicanus]|uniref:uncharacterized protein LOC125786977 n=1 Tax=Astyanax mexicanus TaxID=7994 RepID=UPI0020CAA5C1|nr:uncharacterized protein LOC125786977 [Astyanax mexicanus]
MDSGGIIHSGAEAGAVSNQEQPPAWLQTLLEHQTKQLQQILSPVLTQTAGKDIQTSWLKQPDGNDQSYLVSSSSPILIEGDKEVLPPISSGLPDFSPELEVIRQRSRTSAPVRQWNVDESVEPVVRRRCTSRRGGGPSSIAATLQNSVNPQFPSPDRGMGMHNNNSHHSDHAAPRYSTCCSSSRALASFEGKDDWASFFIPFERMAQRQNWTSTERVDRLHERLRGAAIRFVCSLPEHVREDYALLTEQLAQRYGHTDPPNTARRRLNELRQQKEATAEFAEEIRRLVTLAYPGVDLQLQDQLAADAFLRGLCNQRIAYEVMNKDPPTLTEAQKLVEAHEHNFKATIGRDGELRGKVRRISWADEHAEADMSTSLNVQVPQRTAYATVDQLKLLVEKLEKLQATVDALAHKVSSGEEALPRSETRMEQQRGRTFPQASGKLESARSGGQGLADIQSGHNVSIIQNKNRPLIPPVVTVGRASSEGPSLQIPIQVNHLSIMCIVDTGAEATVMSSEVYKQLDLRNQPESKRACLRNAESGKTMGVFEGYKVTLKIGNKEWDWIVYVAPIQDPLLLGLDFMIKANLTIQRGPKVFIEGDLVPSYVRGGPEGGYAVSRVLLTRPLTIPPQSECDTWGFVEHPHPEITAVLEPVGLADGVSSGSVLINMEPKVPVRLCNISAVSTHLNKGICLGILIETLPLQEECSKDKCKLHSQDQDNPETTKSPGQSDCPGEEKLLRQVRQCCEHNDVLELPAHLQELFTAAGSCLSEEQDSKLLLLLLKYQSVFATSDRDLGHFNTVTHHIDTGNAKPIRQATRRTPLGFQEEEEEHLKQMLSSGVVVPSTSEWASPVVLVRKKDGGVRWCIDFRKLNELTLKDAYPLPNIEECLDTLEGATVFSTLDLQSGYWQIEVHKRDRCKTAFVTKYGLYEYTRMPFGLCNAPSTFQRAMEVVLRGLQWRNLLIYLDDVIVLGTDIDDSLRNLEVVFERMKQYGLKLKPSKCHLLKEEVLFLGHVISGAGIRPNPKLVQEITDWDCPKSPSELQTFLGLCNYYRRFVKSFSQICSPLHELLNKGTEFHWGEAQEAAFMELKKHLTTAPILTYPTSQGTFILDTDASNCSIGAVLSQFQHGEEKVIAYASSHLQKTQRRYCVTRRELLAVVKFTRQFRHYLLGRRFLIRTDHNSLSWLFRFKNPEGQLARWLEELGQYDFQIEHRPGARHGNADALSRKVVQSQCDCYQAGKDLSALPCGGCTHCRRQQGQWARFEADVDDVVPLAIRHVTKCQEIRTVGISPSPKNALCSLSCTQNPDEELPEANWMSQYSMQELEDKQRQDPCLGVLHQWMEMGEVPRREQVALKSPAIRKYWLCWPQVERHRGVLYYRWESDTGAPPQLRLLVPKSLIKELMELCHNSPLSGHLGVGKTLHRARQHFLWHGMGEDVRLFIQKCPQCQASKAVGPTGRAPLQVYQAGAPMDRLHLDIVGPFPISTLGNKYILVIIDQFTRWVEAYAIPDQTAETTVQKLVFEFVARFGSPLEIHTDQGRNFESDLFAQVCHLLRVTKTRTTPYHPSSNGQVERFNRTLLQMIRCFVDKNQRDWDKYLPLLTAAYRSSPHACTGFTPNRMMLGREVHQPQDLLLQVIHLDSNRAPPPEFVGNLEEKMEQAHELAREHLRAAQIRQKRQHDLRAKEQTYEVGDLVYIKDSTKKKGLSPKLQPPWKGPLLISKCLGPVLFEVRDQRSAKVLHHDRLQPYKSDRVPGWIKRLRHSLQGESSRGAECQRDSSTSPEKANQIFGPNMSPCHESSDDNEVGVLPVEVQQAKKPQWLMADPESPPKCPSDIKENTANMQMTRRGRVVRLPQRYKDTSD